MHIHNRKVMIYKWVDIAIHFFDLLYLILAFFSALSQICSYKLDIAAAAVFYSRVVHFRDLL